MSVADRVTPSQRAPRRKQEERSAATRARLLEATVECLVEHGYADTTVARVAERAEVTRGAQVHHYPTKELLVIAAVRHLNALWAQSGGERVDALQAGPDWVDAVLDLLWDQHQGPVFSATVEMWVAARTNPQLAEHLGEVEEIVDETVDGSDRGAEIAPEVRDAMFTAMDAIRGLVMSTWHLSAEETDRRWQRLKKHLALVFPSDG